ncbi:hypothetical protein [Mesorhizobium sp. M4B.F.Ca.ET.013.02.1.1]|uniref:hypothetical protein n=1 Tax=Mesorhizobium sp. M4B.F.Ca.ET.013.02.1.1 TaxID=2496755 RepID=UPI000FD5349D|nr:hypothetical protein [Mesorhizobium sp. M4B.F.Ca.ET.013.02.1.1]RUW24662.1 hypothetical protein EOA34_14285 [Mesorhizobium sp. M4B.F.Ca.ET.013.02.1.1]
MPRTLILTDEEVSLVMAVGQLPHKYAVPLVQSIDLKITKVRAAAQTDRLGKTRRHRADMKPEWERRAGQQSAVELSYREGLL